MLHFQVQLPSSSKASSLVAFTGHVRSRPAMFPPFSTSNQWCCLAKKRVINHLDIRDTLVICGLLVISYSLIFHHLLVGMHPQVQERKSEVAGSQRKRGNQLVTNKSRAGRNQFPKSKKTNIWHKVSLDNVDRTLYRKTWLAVPQINYRYDSINSEVESQKACRASAQRNVGIS